MPGLTLAAALAEAKAAEFVTTTGTPAFCFLNVPYCPMNEPSSSKRPEKTTFGKKTALVKMYVQGSFTNCFKLSIVLKQL